MRDMQHPSIAPPLSSRTMPTTASPQTATRSKTRHRPAPPSPPSAGTFTAGLTRSHSSAAGVLVDGSLHHLPPKYRVASGAPATVPPTPAVDAPSPTWAESAAILSRSRSTAMLTRDLQHELRRAMQVIDQKNVQLASLQGRHTVVRIAREEAAHRRGTRDVRRFTPLPDGPQAFVHDALRELLDEAFVGVQRRVLAAIHDAADVRETSLVAESEGDARLREALRSYKQAPPDVEVGLDASGTSGFCCSWLVRCPAAADCRHVDFSASLCSVP